MMYKLERMEELIYHELRSRFCDAVSARKIMTRYLAVIRELEERHDSAGVQAEMLYRSFQEGVEPEAWLAHIRSTREKYGRLGSAAAGGAEASAAAAAIRSSARQRTGRNVVVLGPKGAPVTVLVKGKYAGEVKHGYKRRKKG